MSGRNVSMKGKNNAPCGRKKLLTAISLLLVMTMLAGCAGPVETGAQIIKNLYYLSATGNAEGGYAVEDDDDSWDDDSWNDDSYDDEYDDYDNDSYDDTDDYSDDTSDDDDYSNDEDDYSDSGDDVCDNNDDVYDGETRQTIMVYMVGSDLESEYGNASLDLTEMMDSGADTDCNNIVVYTGGAEEWQISGLSADENSILLMEDDEFTIVDTTDADNMGDPDTLSVFINYCLDHFDSESYSLILWNHGGGPVVGFGVDENYSDLLNMEELQEAFEDSVGASGKKLEWIGFDACMMSSLEIADVLAPYANYLIASQETEPGWGWNYDFMSCLSDQSMTGEEMGREIIDSYMEFGDTVFDEYPRYYADLTLSCIDLNRYQDAEDALNECFRELDSSLSLKTFPELARNRNDARSFGSYSATFNYCMLDAIHLMQLLGKDSASKNAVAALEDLVVYSRSNLNNAGGISICYPYQTDPDYTDVYIQMQEEMDFTSEYTRFLKDFYAIENGESITKDWNVAQAETNVAQAPSDGITETTGSDISLALTEEQQANFVSGGYYILCNVEKAGYRTSEEDERADEMYLFVHSGNNVSLDENGVLHAYYNNNVVYMHENNPIEGHTEYSDIPMILIEKDSSETEKRYLSFVVLQNFGDDFADWENQAAQMQIVVSKEYPNGIIRSAIPISDDEENDLLNPSKQLLDLDDYENMSVTARCSYITRDENGNMLPFFDWENSGWIMGFDQDLETDYDLRVVPLQNPENYVCMFYLKDAQGNITCSELIPLK